MASTDATIRAGALNKQITMRVRVTGLRVWRARWWVAVNLLKLAARVAGCGIDVHVEKRDGVVA